MRKHAKTCAIPGQVLILSFWHLVQLFSFFLTDVLAFCTLIVSTLPGRDDAKAEKHWQLSLLSS